MAQWKNKVKFNVICYICTHFVLGCGNFFLNNRMGILYYIIIIIILIKCISYDYIYDILVRIMVVGMQNGIARK